MQVSFRSFVDLALTISRTNLSTRCELIKFAGGYKVADAKSPNAWKSVDAIKDLFSLNFVARLPGNF